MKTDYLDLWLLHNIGIPEEVNAVFAKGGVREASRVHTPVPGPRWPPSAIRSPRLKTSPMATPASSVESFRPYTASAVFRSENAAASVLPAACRLRAALCKDCPPVLIPCLSDPLMSRYSHVETRCFQAPWRSCLAHSDEGIRSNSSSGR